MSVRHLVMRFSLSSQSVAEACLKRLTRRMPNGSSGWLEVSTPAEGARGHHYRLGGRGRSSERQWADAGEALFGPGGVLEPYRTRPVFRGNGLGPEGCAVLACVERLGPIGKAEMIEPLSTFVSRSTVTKRLKSLERDGFIRRQGDRYHTPRDLPTRVERFEAEFGLAAKQQDLHGRLLAESLAWQVEIQGGPQITTLKAALRKLACFYCGETAGPTGGTVEHFPPCEWGGSDEASMLLPACGGCNQSHGPLIRSVSIDVIAGGATTLVADLEGPDVRAWIADGTLVAASNYGAAMNRRDVEQALDWARNPFVGLWAAMRRGLDGLKVVNPQTGEIVAAASGDASPDIALRVGAFTGLAELVSPRPAPARVRQQLGGTRPDSRIPISGTERDDRKV